jgi:hypothetical protein
MAFTYTYFRPNEYEGFSSYKFDLKELEWRKNKSLKSKKE